MKIATKQTNLYGACQVVGWTAWSMIELNRYSLMFGFSVGVVINLLLNVLMGIAITHTYRRFIKKLSWLDLPLSKLIPRIILSVTLITVIVVIANIFIDYYSIPDSREYFNSVSALFLFGMFITLSPPYLIWSLVYHMYHYFELSKKNELERVRLSSSVREFEAKLLRSQLNPHFVFNALNSIRALVLENPEKAQVSVTRLSNILRNSLLADRRKTVTLEEELKTIQDYLALEKIRYEDRLSFRMNVPPEAMPVQVPPMMVQTLVENAVKHGISKPINGGFIAVDAELHNGFLHLFIRNTGVLMQIKSEGFGLINTQQRLSLLYGEQARFEIKQESENVVCARVDLPVTTEYEASRVSGLKKNRREVA